MSMNTIVQTLNTAGQAFVGLVVPMLIQASLLILILLAVDALLRKRVRAVFRYWIWMLVLVKLVLPPSLWSPVSVGTWFGDTLEAPAAVLLEPPRLPPPEEQGQDAPAPRLSPAGANFLSAPPPAPVTPPLPEPTVAPQAPAPVPPTSQPAAIARVPALSLNWQGLVLLVWAGVVAALLLLLAQRTFFVRGLIARADEASRALRDELDRCRQHLGLRQQIAARLSPNAASPAVCGLWRPVILIPQSLAARLHGAELQAVLFHELAHIQRGDLWINLLQTLLQIVYFYNPLLWLANAVIRRVREKAVDEMVLVALGEAAPQYPDTLINVAKLALARRPGLSLRLIGVVESKSALTSRIKHILNHPLPKTARLGLLGLLVVFVLAAVLLPMAKGQRPPESRDTIASEEEPEALRYSFPDLAIEASYPNLPGTFLREYRLARSALADAQGAPTESQRAESRRTFEALIRQGGAFPINLYAHRWVIILDWLSGTVHAIEAAQRMNALAEAQSHVAESNLTKAYAAIILARDGHLNRAHDIFVSCSPSETPQWGWFASEMDKRLNRRVEACAPNVNQVVEGKIVQTARTPEQWQAIETELRAAQTAYADYLQYELLPLAMAAITSPRARRYAQVECDSILFTLRHLLVDHAHCFSLGATTHAIETRFQQQIVPKILAAWYQSLELFDKKQQAAEIEGHLQEIKARCAMLNVPWDSLPDWWQHIQSDARNAPLNIKVKWAEAGRMPGSEDRPTMLPSASARGLRHGATSEVKESVGADGAEEQWGRAVEGVQCRLRTDKRVWEEGQSPILRADIRNNGNHHLRVAPTYERCALVLDGRTYRWPTWEFVELKGFPPLGVYRDIIIPIVETWAGGMPLKLDLGLHQISVVFQCQGTNSQGETFAIDVESNTVEIEIVAKQAADARGDGLPGKYSARLSNGVTVELLGVCEYPSDGRQWWQPDGEILTEAPCTRHRGDKMFPMPEERAYEFCLRLRHLPSGGQTTIKIPSSYSVMGGSGPALKDGTYQDDLRWSATILPKDRRNCTVRCGVAAGTWQTAAQTRGQAFSAQGTTIGGITLSPANDDPEAGAMITSSDDILDRPCRVVAVTTDGRIVPASRTSGGTAGRVRQTTSYFRGLTLAQIAEFRFQTRPWTWVEFKNVSLRPGRRTDVQTNVLPEDTAKSLSVAEPENVSPAAGLVAAAATGPVIAQRGSSFACTLPRGGPDHPLPDRSGGYRDRHGCPPGGAADKRASEGRGLARRGPGPMMQYQAEMRS
jgi:beta-lactamase regulating signal transducer with metallopeptidase domain